MIYDDVMDARKVESDGSWTRSTILDISAKSTRKNTINREYIAHNWHFVFPVFRALDIFFEEVWLVFDASEDAVPGHEFVVGCSIGGNVANVSRLDGSGCDRWETKIAEWGLLFDLLPWDDFLWRSALCELVDNPDEAEDTQLLADETASYNEWSNVLL